jgi:hypothetical protein
MDISLSTFTVFVATSARNRHNVVRDTLLRQNTDFDLAADYWFRLRRTIADAHRKGDAEIIREFRPKDARKTENYTTRSAAYLKWLNGRRVEWLGAPRRTWSSGGLTVGVSPHLPIAINGRPHTIHLWCRNEPLDADRVAPVLCLLSQLYGEPGRKVGLLDVQRGRFLAAGRKSDGLESLLVGEAAAFVAIWHEIRRRAVVVAPIQ